MNARMRHDEATLAPAADVAAGPAARSALERPLASAIYEGWVRHRRLAPHANAFRYRTAMLYLDLAEIDHVFQDRWLWSVENRNIAQFRRNDYMAPHDLPLDEAVRRRVEAATGRFPSGPIRLLTHLRYFGHCFNPVSFYYCYEADGQALQAIVTEITNTPWKERHAYVLPVNEAGRHAGALAWHFAKRFHVSPFMPMQRDYAWRFTVPGEALRVHMDVLRHGEREFDATLVLKRRALDGAGLARVLWRYPAMTMKVVAAIHWQALRLFVKRNPVYDHPRKKQGS